eukprot:COSAG05_NODE_1064_length_5991_cov_12.180414_2_plen_80_part_00
MIYIQSAANVDGKKTWLLEEDEKAAAATAAAVREQERRRARHEEKGRLEYEADLASQARRQVPQKPQTITARTALDNNV